MDTPQMQSPPHALPPDLRREYVTIMRACDLAQVTRRTIYTWMKEGKIDWFLTASGRRRIYVDSLFRTRDNQRAAGYLP